MSTELELPSIIEDLRRHLSWQRELGGELLYDTVENAAAARAARLALARAEAGRPASTAAVPSRAFTPRPVAAPMAGSAPAPASVPATALARPAVEAKRPAPQPAPAPGPGQVIRGTLDEVRVALGDCKRCKLCQGRKKIVFGSGNPRAKLVFVGEGPGADEDIQGLPFVGKAGQLLTKMIEAMGLSRDDVYICNVVKCRPPGNRNPEPDEIAACEPFLQGQLAALQPQAIVALGKFAAQTLLRDTTPITRLRGTWREYQGIKLMPTYHPAYLLRNPEEKRAAWTDLQQVMAFFKAQAGGA